MRQLSNFLKLPASYRKTLLVSFFALVFVKLGLKIIRYNRLSKILPRASREAPQHLLDRLGWCVPQAAKLVPGATCLPQAFAAQLMLAFKGYRAEMLVGARRDEKGQFLAHAWLLSNGKVVLGGTESELSSYATFNNFPSFQK